MLLYLTNLQYFSSMNNSDYFEQTAFYIRVYYITRQFNIINVMEKIYNSDILYLRCVHQSVPTIRP